MPVGTFSENIYRGIYQQDLIIIKLLISEFINDDVKITEKINLYKVLTR